MQVDGPNKLWLFSVFYNLPCMGCGRGRYISTRRLKARFCSECLRDVWEDDADLRRVLDQLRSEG
jgi:hypothetical protein